MTASPTNQELSCSAWTWPVELSAYDRTSTLSAAEYEALADRVQRSDTGHALFSVHMAPVLQRLTRPLADVFELTGALPQVRREVTHLFLREMYFRQAAIWGWTHDDWVDLFNVERPQRLAHRLSFYRHQVFVIGYVLCNFTDFAATGHVVHYPIAVKVFGKATVDSTIQRVQTVLLGWGYSATRCAQYLTKVMCVILLANRSPRLEDLTTERLTAIVRQSAAYLEDDLVLVSRVLVHLGILARPVTPAVQRETTDAALQNVPTIWGQWCQRWRATSTLAPSTRQSIYYYLLTAGRWLAQTHPEVETPEDWTRDLAIEYVAAVDRMTVGQWANHALPPAIVGKPLAPRVKVHHLSSIRVFFRDCQEWGWITRRFDPGRCLRVPRAVRALVGPNPRVIADDVWAKLLWAGLNLTADDLLRRIDGAGGCALPPRSIAIPWQWCVRLSWSGYLPACATMKYAGSGWDVRAGNGEPHPTVARRSHPSLLYASWTSPLTKQGRPSPNRWIAASAKRSELGKSSGRRSRQWWIPRPARSSTTSLPIATSRSGRPI